MNTEELSNRLTQILTGITSGEPNPNIIQGFVQNFSKTSTYTLNGNIANTNLIILITMETNFEYLIQILRDPSLDTWTLEEQQEINNLDLSQGLHHFLYDAYTGIITYQPNKLKQVSSDIYTNQTI